MRWLRLSVPLVCVLSLVVPNTAAAAVPLEPTLDSIWSEIFLPYCSTCHFDDSGLGFWADTKQNAFDTLVDRPAIFCENQIRVIPGNAAASHLIKKLEGTMECGDRMPLGDLPFDQPTINVIRDWIDNGALFEPPIPTAGVTWSSIKSLYR